MTDETDVFCQQKKTWQSAERIAYEALYVYKSFRLKVDIQAHKKLDQSWARLRVFDPQSLKWNIIATTAPVSRTDCSGPKEKVNEKLDGLANDLIDEGLLILGD